MQVRQRQIVIESWESTWENARTLCMFCINRSKISPRVERECRATPCLSLLPNVSSAVSYAGRRMSWSLAHTLVECSHVCNPVHKSLQYMGIPLFPCLTVATGDGIWAYMMPKVSCPSHQGHFSPLLDSFSGPCPAMLP